MCRHLSESLLSVSSRFGWLDLISHPEATSKRLVGMPKRLCFLRASQSNLYNAHHARAAADSREYSKAVFWLAENPPLPNQQLISSTPCITNRKEWPSKRLCVCVWVCRGQMGLQRGTART